MSCEAILNAYGNVSALCIDRTNGCIVVGVQETIRYILTNIICIISKYSFLQSVKFPMSL